MVMTGDDYEMDLDINQIISRERWENGQFHSSLNRIQGDGAFDFSEEEDNSSIVVNATVYDFFQNQSMETKQVIESTLTVPFLVTSMASERFVTSLQATTRRMQQERNLTSMSFLLKLG